ncbi:hypothetical protein BLNAU_9798 [Blattamonas nauphoetae]|uniref:Uncharacterized protein n=1 Tax=Blattamonas nauphoetae TaxID=2049346 RepID=A0ABQ9XUU4_9EUKA|nr:hypothetical protein BLNAU_9798 [Blattamonas nauphoetae]
MNTCRRYLCMPEQFQPNPILWLDAGTVHRDLSCELEVISPRTWESSNHNYRKLWLIILSHWATLIVHMSQTESDMYLRSAVKVLFVCLRMRRERVRHFHESMPFRDYTRPIRIKSIRKIRLLWRRLQRNK